MSEPHSPSQLQVRLALPRDRRQIRLLLRDYHRRTSRSRWRYLWRYFKSGLGLAVVLHWLFKVLGLQLLYLGGLILGCLTLVGWLNLWLFEDWQHYWVIEQEQRLIACARLTSYRTYVVLSDVAVAIDWRQHGVGSQLLQAIVQRIHLPIYLACRAELTDFYQRFGFQPANPQLLSAYLKREIGWQEELQALWRPELLNKAARLELDQDRSQKKL